MFEFKLEDFTGALKLVGNRFNNINEYISYYTPIVTTQVLGFIPVETSIPRFERIETAQYNNGLFYSLPDILKHLIYYYIVRDDFIMTDTGAITNKNENSEKVKQHNIAKDRYNTAMTMLTNLYKYMDSKANLTTTDFTINFSPTQTAFFINVDLGIGEGDKITLYNDLEMKDGIDVRVESAGEFLQAQQVNVNGIYPDVKVIKFDTYGDIIKYNTDKIIF